MTVLALAPGPKEILFVVGTQSTGPDGVDYRFDTVNTISTGNLVVVGDGLYSAQIFAHHRAVVLASLGYDALVQMLAVELRANWATISEGANLAHPSIFTTNIFVAGYSESLAASLVAAPGC